MIIYEVWIHHNGEHIKLWETEDYSLACQYIYSYPKKSGERLTKRKRVIDDNNR